MQLIKDFIESTAGAIVILFTGLCVFSGACVVSAVQLPNNERIGVLFSGLVGNFSGALLTIITIRNRVNVTGGDNQTTVVNNGKPVDPQAEPKV